MPETKRVLQVLGTSTGGIRSHVRALSIGLMANGFEVALAGPATSLPDIEGADRYAVDVPHRNQLRPRALAASRRALAEVVTGSGADLIHAHGLTAGWLAATLPRRPPLVVSVHNLVLDEVAGRRRATTLRILEARLPARADAVIAISQGVAKRFARGAGAEKVTVIAPVWERPHPSASPAEVRAGLGLTSGQPLIVTVARLSPQKGLFDLLAAATLLGPAAAEACWVVIGEGAQQAELEATITQRGLDGRVVLAGPRHPATNELAAADVVVVPSLWESGPLVVLEALDLARPVVSTAVGLAPDVVEPGVSGHLVRPGDSAALAAAVTEVLGDPGRARAEAEAGQRRVRERYLPEVLVDVVSGLYRSVMEERS